MHQKLLSQQNLLKVAFIPAGGEAFVFDPDLEGGFVFQRPECGTAEGAEVGIRMALAKAALVFLKRDGETPLHCAAEIGCLDLIRLLIEHGARVNAKCIDWTPLHVAIFGRHGDVARLLIENGAGINAKNNFGRTPLSLAAGAGLTDIARLLIEKGAKVNAKNAFGRTALHDAVVAGHAEIVRLLIENGADVTIADVRGVTPRQLADPHPEIGELLEAAARPRGGHAGRVAKRRDNSGGREISG